MDLTGLLLTLFLTVMTITEIKSIPQVKLRLMAALASCILVIKVYDWLRLFEGTAFYIHLIDSTFKDIR